MKTILHVIDTTGPGGAETVFIDIATGLPSEKYRPIVVIRGKGWVYEELRRRGVHPVILNAKGSFNWRYLLDLSWLVHKEGVDLIQSHLLGSNVYCALLGLITRKPVVATFHGVVDIGDNESLKWLKFRAIRLGARSIVAVSNSLRASITKKTPLTENKITVIYNGIRTSDFQRPRSDKLRQQNAWSKDDIIIGSLGNIRRAKGYDILLRAAALLKQSERSYRFLIAGQSKPGNLYQGLLEQRKRLGLGDRVQFLGFMEDPAGFLSNLDLFLLTSTSEGFSIATIQAMAANLPVIVTRSGGPEEIVVHKETGWLVDTGDPGTVAEAIERLITDRELSSRLASCGREHAINTFDIHVMLSAYEEIYAGLVHSASADPG